MRVFQEVDQLFDFFFRFVATGHVGKCGGVVGLIEHARFGLTKTEGTALAAALHLAHEIDPDADQEQHGAPRDQDAHQDGRLFARLDVKLHATVDQVTHQTTIQIGGGAAQTFVVGGDGNDFSPRRPLLQHHALDAFAANLFQKVRVANLIGLGSTPVKLLEDGEKHQSNHQPHSDLRKPLIVHRASFCSKPSPEPQLRLPSKTGTEPDSARRYMGRSLCQSSP